MPFDWTPEAEARLKSMAVDGHSGPEIARALGGGLTRNAVAGKAMRMGVELHRPSPPRPVAERGAMTATGTRPPRGRRKGLCLSALNPNCNTGEAKPPKKLASQPTPAPDAPPPLSFDAVIDSRGCKWEVAGALDARDMKFCGMMRQPGSAYCAHHHGRAHRPPMKWEKSL